MIVYGVITGEKRFETDDSTLWGFRFFVTAYYFNSQEAVNDEHNRASAFYATLKDLSGRCDILIRWETVVGKKAQKFLKGVR